MSLLTINKKFEISTSYRYYRKNWSDEKNKAVFGNKVGTASGYGGNWNAYFVFTGPVDPDTGMMINVTVIKERINKILSKRYDHKYLNIDTPPYDTIIPTPENVATQLLEECQSLFDDSPVRLCACHLECSPFESATAYDSGLTERHLWLEFSAARRTYSPHLTDEENRQLFGMASAVSGHGHYYRLKATLRGKIDSECGMIYPENEAGYILDELHDMLDHKNLNVDVRELSEIPITTECLSKFIYDYLGRRMPVNRIQLWENPYFYAEYLGDDQYTMGLKSEFHAAHRLHSDKLSNVKNIEVFGKCNNPAGHGHRYIVEAALDGKFDEKSGILFPLFDFQNALNETLDKWNYKHLDHDTDDFQENITTGENIVSILCPKIEKKLGRDLVRLRLWETPNNRFTIRKNHE